jgi:hypothetical protein
LGNTAGKSREKDDNDFLTLKVRKSLLAKTLNKSKKTNNKDNQTLIINDNKLSSLAVELPDMIIGMQAKQNLSTNPKLVRYHKY